MNIHGSCHCSNIRFELDWQPEPEFIPARACTCTFCRKHGGVWTACPAGALRVRIREPGRVSRYAFETRTADFHICTLCGAVPFATSEIDGRVYAVVSVNAFDDVDPALLRRSDSNLDGEHESARLERRKRNWVGQVEIVAGA